MSNKISDIRIADLLEQIQEIDKLIHLYQTKANDRASIFMIKQYTARREEFVAQLNEVFTQFSLNLTQLDPIGIKREYASEIETYSFANEPVSDYGTKDKLT
jgi:hypothetical protein